MSDIPVAQPLLTDALVQLIHLENEEEGELEYAHDTAFRHSDAGRCARALGYSLISRTMPDGVEPEARDKPDLAGEWVMYLGSLIHRKVQDALEERYGSGCEAEARVRHGTLSSGHIDLLIERVPGIGRVVYELKTKGGYGFDKAIGINRKAYKLEMPAGPGMAAKIQGALNAAAVDADLLIIGVIGLEAISKQLAGRVGFGDLARIMGEWHYTKAEYAPWAERELKRFHDVEQTVQGGFLPARIALGDEGEDVRLDPNGDRVPWQCVYCSWRSVCEKEN